MKYEYLPACWHLLDIMSEALNEYVERGGSPTDVDAARLYVEAHTYPVDKLDLSRFDPTHVGEWLAYALANYAPDRYYGWGLGATHALGASLGYA
jgi:hypothetical protein